MNDFLASFHTRQQVGTVSVTGKAQCFGWCQDAQNTLVAVSVLGGVTATRAVWAALNDQRQKGLQLRIGDQDFNTTYAWKRDCTYRFFETRIPKSNYISLIALNDAFFGIPKDREIIYLPYTSNREDMNARLHERVKQIVFLPVKKEWGSYLYEEGEMRRMCGPLLDGAGANRYQGLTTKGFSVFWLYTQRERWEKLITEGLRNRKISIGPADAEMEGVRA